MIFSTQMSKENNKLVVILGPTGSGKSNLAVKLAKKFRGEIVSADSRQIYIGMDIGTAKVTRKEMAGIRHYLLDIVNPSQEYSLAQYKEAAVNAIKKIQRKNKVPFLVGGTGLYIQAIVDNLDIPQVPPDKRLRRKIEKEIEKRGLKNVYKKLLKLDPGALNIVDPRNPRRVIRALEVCLKTKKPFSNFYRKGEPLFEVLQIGIKTNRQQLYKKIDQRVDLMVKQGLVDEVKRLAKKYDWHLPSMSGIGYKEIGEYLQGKNSLTDAGQKMKYRTHAYVRRQITWFNRDKRIKWIKNINQAKNIIKKFVKK